MPTHRRELTSSRAPGLSYTVSKGESESGFVFNTHMVYKGVPDQFQTIVGQGSGKSMFGDSSRIQIPVFAWTLTDMCLQTCEMGKGTRAFTGR